ncbi:MAG TPA: hypothetical protein VG602_01450 [Actinomycetota bacterium]|nr:hypothetical protein [Actinomycetota bacterium]
MARYRLLALFSSLFVLFAFPVSAQEGPAPTQASVTASLQGTTVAVTGTVTFGGQALQTVATDVTGDGPLHADLSRDLGVDLVAARVHQPNPNEPTLVFEWQPTNLPAPIPEGVRYFWPFLLNTPAGDKTYFLQAKFTNLASITVADDPAGHVTHSGAAFQLRGNCGTLVAIQNCGHLGWLEGEYDLTEEVVRIELPIGSALAPDVVPGARLIPFDYAGGTIAVAYQAAVSNATTTDFADWTEEFVYTVPSKRVSLGIAPAGADPANVSFSKQATLEGDGFSGSLDVSGLAPGSYEVFAKACFADNCDVATAPFTII